MYLTAECLEYYIGHYDKFGSEIIIKLPTHECHENDKLDISCKYRTFVDI